MLLKSESDFIYATNIAYDLGCLVTNYLELHRNYINGYKGVSITDKPFSLSFSPSRKEGFISICVHWVETQTYSKPIYYDVDSDYFSESWGSDNISGYETEVIEYPSSNYIQIPISHLKMNKEDMKNFFIQKKNLIEEERKEICRKNRIEELEKELEGLR